MPRVIQTNNTCIKKEDFFTGYLLFDDPIAVINENETGELSVKLTDSYRRTVDIFKYAVSCEQIEQNEQNGGNKIYFDFPLEKTLTMVNYIEVIFNEGNNNYNNSYAAPVYEFIVTPDVNELDDYNIIMYYPYENQYQNNLREIGITAGQVQSGRAIPDGDSLLKANVWWRNNFRFYVDQIALEYYANYHSPMYNPKEKLLLKLKEKYKTGRTDKTDKSVFVRTPCFFDENALNKAMNRIDSAVTSQKKFKPLLYSTDECGVADLETAWDFCFDERTLTEMRKWLIEIYGNLENINKEWGTDFVSIDDVTPYTTDEIIARDGKDKKDKNNLSPWADHRHFMNKCFCDAVKKAREQAHLSDPEAKWGLVGCQMPAAFGGYDYWLLEKSVDAFEPYNIGNNREIIRSINPAKPCITTSSGHSDDEVWRLWHQALHGDRGIIIYDENNSYLNSDGSPTQIGLSCKPVYNELISGLIKQYTYTSELPAKASIHYSQASITAFWELEIRAMQAEGSDWVDRGSGTDRFDSEFFRLRESAVKLFEDNQAPYKFTAYGELENGDFEKYAKNGINIIFLPQSIAMSKKEIQALKRFANSGGTVVADCSCALMDEHCKEIDKLDKSGLDEFFGISGSRIEKTPSGLPFAPINDIPDKYEWAKPLLEISELTYVSAAHSGITVPDGALALFKDKNGVPAVIIKNYGMGRTVYLNLDVTNYHRWRLRNNEGDSIRKLFGALLNISNSNPYTPITENKGNSEFLEIFNRRSGNMEIIAAHRNYQLRVSELGPPEYQDMSGLQKEFDIEIDLGKKRAVYNLRKGEFLGITDKVSLNMPVWEPVIIAAFDSEIKSMTVNTPETSAVGEIIPVSAQLDADSPAENHVFRFTVISPDGEEIPYYAQNILAPYGKARWSFPIAKDAELGCYKISVKDVATGVSCIKEAWVR